MATRRERGRRLLKVSLTFFLPFGRGSRVDVVEYVLVILLLFIPLGGLHLIIGDIHATDEERIYGRSYDTPGFLWARVMNRYGVQTADALVRRFENCLLLGNGHVTEVTNQTTWWSRWKEQVLVEYTPPEGKAATGVLCPKGTVFYLPRAKLEAFPPVSRQRRLDEQAGTVRKISGTLQ